VIKSPKAPFRSVLVDNQGKISRDWIDFINSTSKTIEHVGEEVVLPLENNTTVTDFLKVDSKKETYVVFQIIAHRQSDSDFYFVEHTLRCYFDPDSNVWAGSDSTATLSNTVGPSQLVITVNSDGTIQFVTTNFPGTISYDRVAIRKNAFAMKDSRYSRMG
jgi:hypothetical protein